MEISILNWRISVERVFWSERRLQDSYDEAAARWQDAIQRTGTIEAYDWLWDALRRDGVLDSIPHDGTILDAGLGTGALSHALMPALPSVAWHGIDLSAGMLEEAGARSPYPMVLEQASITDLPYSDDTFDCVMTAHVVEHLETPLAGIRELLRVLKAGQPFVLIATRRCLWTQALSLRWNFSPLAEADVCRWLYESGADNVNVRKLLSADTAQPHFLSDNAHISLVYTGVKRA
ncbi:MAG: class I SAM-dependent methyltransferase [Chloroflexota bacterium]